MAEEAILKLLGQSAALVEKIFAEDLRPGGVVELEFHD